MLTMQPPAPLPAIRHTPCPSLAPQLPSLHHIPHKHSDDLANSSSGIYMAFTKLSHYHFFQRQSNGSKIFALDFASALGPRHWLEPCQGEGCLFESRARTRSTTCLVYLKRKPKPIE
ncbi:hypothetical protein BTVI_113226 [Pitangus sulphuratus]|nr:hypothetical protein BTVI_113226 [Pitangus sulphuratus]